MKTSLFIASICLALFMLVIENLVGINWNFHPDAVTYTTYSFEMVDNLIEADFIASFNNFYYIVAAVFQQDVAALITLNIFIYGLTNVMIFIYVNRIATKYKLIFNTKLIIFLACILFMPYRLHLAVHVLKDTFIIFFLLGLLSKNMFVRASSIFFIVGLRLFSFVYMTIFLKKKYFYTVALLAGTYAAYISQESIDLIERTNDVDMAFREFDQVPNFSAYGVLGTIFRLILWPLLAFTGGYLILSPSIAFAPLSIGSMAICIITWWSYKKLAINIPAFIIFGLIAVLTTGFTTYIRYCFPLLILVPLLQFNDFAKSQYLQNLEKK